MIYVCLLVLAHQVTTNGLIFTIFGVFEAHVSIRHFPNDDCNTDGFVVKKKVKIIYHRFYIHKVTLYTFVIYSISNLCIFLCV